MNEDILGVCPTCYLVVKNSDKYSLEISSDGQIAYHRDCEPRRMEYMRTNKPKWESEGDELRKLRIENRFTIGEIAEYLGVSESKLRKFEKGLPVTHARLVAMSYIMFFKLYSTQEIKV